VFCGGVYSFGKNLFLLRQRNSSRQCGEPFACKSEADMGTEPAPGQDCGRRSAQAGLCVLQVLKIGQSGAGGLTPPVCIIITPTGNNAGKAALYRCLPFVSPVGNTHPWGILAGRFIFYGMRFFSAPVISSHAREGFYFLFSNEGLRMLGSRMNCRRCTPPLALQVSFAGRQVKNNMDRPCCQVLLSSYFDYREYRTRLL